MELRPEKARARGLKGRTEDVLLRESHHLDRRAGAHMWQVLDHGCKVLGFISKFLSFLACKAIAKPAAGSE